MLSRCASLEQLTIVDLDNIRVDEDVQAETINNKPCYWMNPKAAGLKVSSLRRHFDDVKSDPALLQSDILCLQELWLHPGEEEGERCQIDSFRGHFTCVGPRKGVAVYVKDKTASF